MCESAKRGDLEDIKLSMNNGGRHAFWKGYYEFIELLVSGTLSGSEDMVCFLLEHRSSWCIDLALKQAVERRAPLNTIQILVEHRADVNHDYLKVFKMAVAQKNTPLFQWMLQRLDAEPSRVYGLIDFVVRHEAQDMLWLLCEKLPLAEYEQLLWEAIVRCESPELAQRFINFGASEETGERTAKAFGRYEAVAHFFGTRAEREALAEEVQPSEAVQSPRQRL